MKITASAKRWASHQDRSVFSEVVSMDKSDSLTQLIPNLRQFDGCRPDDLSSGSGRRGHTIALTRPEIAFVIDSEDRPKPIRQHKRAAAKGGLVHAGTTSQASDTAEGGVTTAAKHGLPDDPTTP